MTDAEFMWATVDSLNQCCRLLVRGQQLSEFNRRMLATSTSRALTEEERLRARALFELGLNGPPANLSADDPSLGDGLQDLFVDVYARYKAAGGVARFDGDERLRRRGFTGQGDGSKPAAGDLS